MPAGEPASSGEPEGPVRDVTKSEAAFARARQCMPGGVSSPVRAFGAVGGTPLFIREGEGCRVEDLDGNSYIDYVGSYGPLIAGHANERVLAAISKAAGRGTTYGSPTLVEVELAEAIVSAFAGMEMVRFVSSGTEAMMSAIRLARAATGRETIIKCIGCYHGHADALLVEAAAGGSQVHPSSAGVHPGVIQSTRLVPYNDLESARLAFEENPGQVACFIVEPIAGNMGLVLPRPGYLRGLRELCNEFGTLLIFDELLTGFRVAWGGAQTLYEVRPDLTCLGKIIGGGLPAAAYGGPARLMEQVSPTGPVYQAGSLSGNPLAMAAGLATLDILRDTGGAAGAATAYELLEHAGAELERGLRQAAARRGVPLTINRAGSMLGVYLTAAPDTAIEDFAAVAACPGDHFARLFHALLDGGVMIPPSRFEAWFVSLAHAPDEIQRTLDAADRAFEAMAGP